MNEVVIAQIISIIGYIIMAISFWKKTYRDIMLCQIIAILLFMVQFVVLQAYSGAIINLVNIAKTLYFAKSQKQTKDWPMLVGFVLLISVGTLWTWQNIFSVFSWLAGIIYLLASYSRKSQTVRKGAILSSVAWIVYDTYSMAYSSAFFEFAMIISNFIAIKRNKK